MNDSAKCGRGKDEKGVATRRPTKAQDNRPIEPRTSKVLFHLVLAVFAVLFVLSLVAIAGMVSDDESLKTPATLLGWPSVAVGLIRLVVLIKRRDYDAVPGALWLVVGGFPFLANSGVLEIRW